MKPRGESWLAAARRDLRPSSDRRDQNWVALRAKLAKGDVPDLPLAPPFETGEQRPWQWIAAASIVGAAALLGGALGLGADQVMVAPNGSSRDLAVDHAVGRPLRKADRSPPAARPGPPQAISVEEPAQGLGSPAPKSRSNEPRTAKDGSSFEAEVALLRHAREAVTTDPARALVLCEEHRRRFSRAQLAAERWSIVIAAHCALDHHAEARAAAESFARAFPESEVARSHGNTPCSTISSRLR